MTRTSLLPSFSPLRRGFRRAGSFAVCLAFATAAWTHPTISGTVVIAETGEPAHDAEVLLIQTDQVVHTDGDGRFAFVDVDHVGSVTLHVDLGFLSAVRTVVIDIDQEEDFELSRAHRPRSAPPDARTGHGHRLGQRFVALRDLRFGARAGGARPSERARAQPRGTARKHHRRGGAQFRTRLRAPHRARLRRGPGARHGGRRADQRSGQPVGGPRGPGGPAAGRTGRGRAGPGDAALRVERHRRHRERDLHGVPPGALAAARIPGAGQPRLLDRRLGHARRRSRPGVGRGLVRLGRGQLEPDRGLRLPGRGDRQHRKLHESGRGGVWSLRPAGLALGDRAPR